MARKKSPRKSPRSPTKTPKKTGRKRKAKKSPIDGITNPALSRLMKSKTGISRVSPEVFNEVRKYIKAEMSGIMKRSAAQAAAAKRKTIMESDIDSAIDLAE